MSWRPGVFPRCAGQPGRYADQGGQLGTSTGTAGGGRRFSNSGTSGPGGRREPGRALSAERVSGAFVRPCWLFRNEVWSMRGLCWSGQDVTRVPSDERE